jgi:aryl-alcohol dehydrogenase-like predicted oxidoreductase
MINPSPLKRGKSIARVPLYSVHLSATGQNTVTRTSNLIRSHTRCFRGERFAETVRRVAALKTETALHYSSLAEAAMRYLLPHDAVSVLISRMKNPAEVDLHIRYCNGTLVPQELLDKLTRHPWVWNFYR